MKRFLVFSLTTLFLTTPAIPTMANDNPMEIDSTYLSIEQEYEELDLETLAWVVFDQPIFDASGTYQSRDFTINRNETPRTNIWFQNNGTAPVTVSLLTYPLIGNPNQDSLMTLQPGQANFVTRTLANNRDYAIRITSNNGSPVEGRLRINQTDSN